MGKEASMGRQARAVAGNQIIRQYIYLYGAFCPQTGESFFPVLPYADGACMRIFLKEVSKQYARYRIIMAMDNAAWHKVQTNIDNIVPLFQPPYSP